MDQELTFTSLLETIQRRRIEADVRLQNAERRDATSSASHALRGRYVALLEIENDLREAMAADRLNRKES